MNNEAGKLKVKDTGTILTVSEILESIHHAIFATDLEGEILYWNKGGEELFGYPKEEIMGKNISALYRYDRDRGFNEDVKHLREKEKVTRQWLAEHCDGSPIWVDLKLKLLKEDREKGARIIGSACDIDSQKDAESQLQLKDARAKAIFDTMVNGIISIDSKGNILAFNKAAEDIFGYSKEEVIGGNVSILMPHPHRQKHDEYIENYLKTGAKKIIGIGREVRGMKKDGSTFPMELAVSEVNSNRENFFIGIIRDISDRRELEKEIVQISDNEKMRIGRDLHDGLGQMLTGIGLMGRNLVRKMAANGIPGTDKLKEIVDMIKEADRYARTLSHNLIPVEMDSGGLEIALKQMCERVKNLYDLKCTFIEKGKSDIGNKDTAFHLYSICQEAINNAVKHGKASEVEVTLENSSDGIKLTVVDDGVGFNENELEENHDGMGINIMRHRAQISGGELTISETEDGKTSVECHIRYH